MFEAAVFIAAVVAAVVTLYVVVVRAVVACHNGAYVGLRIAR